MMRAKFQLGTVTQNIGPSGDIQSVQIGAFPVTGNAPFGPNGESEDNTYARYSPSGELKLTITNPELFGKFKPGQKFYLNFTEAES